MKKIFVSANECKPGMRIAEDIYNEYGAIIIAENMLLDDYIIMRIRELGFTRIKVYENSEEMVAVSGTELFRAQYNENVDTIKGLLHDISSGKNIDSERVNEATNSIILRINENKDIVDFVNEMRKSDEYLYTHSINVSFLSMLIGKWLKYDYKSIKSLVTSAYLHDIGMVKIPTEIINKPDSLTPEEYDEVKKHCQYGFKAAQTMPDINDDTLKGILMHHEREDGSGYPFGLKSNQIHDNAKIIAVADIYDAMTSDRAYRSKTCPFDVIECIQKDYFRKLDQRVVNIFLGNIASYYIGNFVKLSSGNIGEIIYINQNIISKPIIRINGTYIDLSKDRKVKIIELV